ncbi:MAG: DUF58 domain-containing protein [Eubacteriales bacterium]|nr:DUF58 domain-containing protein [Eubacteriales bacterium]
MTQRLKSALVTGAFMLYCALSLGDTVYYLISITIGLMLIYALFCVLTAYLTLDFSQQLDSKRGERGDTAKLSVNIKHSCFLPMSPFNLELQMPSGEANTQVNIKALKVHTMQLEAQLKHVGLFGFGVKKIVISDIFAFFEIKKQFEDNLPQVLSLPRSFEIDKLSFPPGDDGKALKNESGEDISAPEDIRSYRPGDPLKRIHWKLSVRLNEPIVRRFEVPAPPDTLILVDLQNPVLTGNIKEEKLRLQDTVCETALSVGVMQLKENRPVRVPLYGSSLGEYRQDNINTVEILKEELALELFREAMPFEEVISIELGRMQRTGASVLVTTRLNAKIVDLVADIRRTGAMVRFYFISFKPESPENIPYITRLQHHFVEVRYVTPA